MKFLTMSVLLFCGLANASSNMIVNDLPRDEDVELDVQVLVSKTSDSDAPAVYFSIAHEYTNTLSCDLEFELPDENMRIERFSVNDVAIFPPRAFPYQGQYKVDPMILANLPLRIGTKTVLVGAARCHGYDLRSPLPESVCRKFNPSHERTCQLYVPRGDTYPLLVNYQLFGACRCP